MIEKIRKTGVITKGIIYTLVGLLTLLAALNLGGKVAGKNEVIQFLEKQPFGIFLLYAIAIGLLLYAIWRLYSAFLDIKNEGSNKQGLAKRVGYFISGLIYGALSISLFTSSSNNSKQSLTETVLNINGGVIILFKTSLILAGVGCYQIYKGYSNSFLEEINQNTESKTNKVLKQAGTYGHISRGISFIIFAIFVFTAANQENANAIKGLEGMFNYLQSFSLGNIVMGIVAIGFIFYGIYQYFLARYSSVY